MVSSIRRLALQTGPGTKLRQRYRSLRAVQVLGNTAREHPEYAIGPMPTARFGFSMTRSSTRSRSATNVRWEKVLSIG